VKKELKEEEEERRQEKRRGEKRRIGYNAKYASFPNPT